MRQQPPSFHAFTLRANGALNSIVTDIALCEAYDPANAPSPLPTHYETTALWDTGATNSVITAHTAKQLGLSPSGKTHVSHAGGSGDSNTYVVNFVLPNKVGVAGILVSECPAIANGVGALIGMDIIIRGDFSITNANGCTWMTYRIPSIAGIDYVADAKDIRYAGVGRNDPCPCGKADANGKPVKYKHCCLHRKR